MAGIPFSPNSPDLEAVRQIIFARLRAEPGWKQLDYADPAMHHSSSTRALNGRGVTPSSSPLKRYSGTWSSRAC